MAWVASASLLGHNPHTLGGVAERLMALVLKTREGKTFPGFESPPLRHCMGITY